MPKKTHLFLLMAALAAVMIFGVVLSSEAGTRAFLDMGEASWAEQNITEMSSIEILQGYPDGKFLPYQSVTRLEVLAMLIRMLDLDDQAREMDDDEVDYEVPSNLPWGRGYLIKAVEMDMLDKNYLNQLEPTGPATRAQVAALVCLALDLEAADSDLDFTDTAQIPSGYRGYVTTLVNNKIMQGLPGNVFEPNSVINRAQMAVLLSNLLNKDFANPCPDRSITGRISEIEPVSGTITLEGGTSMFLTAECRYYRDGVKADVADIQTGNVVRLVLDENDQVIFVRVLDADQQAYVYVDGEVQSFDSDEITLKDEDGYLKVYPLDDDVKVTIDGVTESLSDLNTGSQVRMKLDSDGWVDEIEVLSSGASELEGEISALDTSGTYWITIQNSNEDKFTYLVAGDVDVYDGDSGIDFEELETGDKVRLELDSEGWVDKIEVLVSGANKLEGEISDLDASGTYWITIQNSNDEKFTYLVVDDVDVNDGDSGLDFEELEPGDKVQLVLDSDGWVDEIELLEGQSGIITSLATGSSPGLWYAGSGSDEVYYIISGDVECTRDGDSIGLDDIVTGSEADIEVENDEVAAIEITDDKNITVEGEVTYVSLSSEKVIIEQESGNQFSYYLADGSVLRDSTGDTINLSDVEVGWDVTLKLDDGEIHTLTEQ